MWREKKSKIVGGNSRSPGQAIWRLTALEPWWKCGSSKVMFLAKWNITGLNQQSPISRAVGLFSPLLLRTLTCFCNHFLKVWFSLLAYINTHHLCHVAMAVNATLCCWSFRSTCQLQRQVSEGRFWRWSRTDCVHICLGGFNSKSHNGLISLSLILPSVLSYKTATHCVHSLLFVLSHRFEMRNTKISSL